MIRSRSSCKIVKLCLQNCEYKKLSDVTLLQFGDHAKLFFIPRLHQKETSVNRAKGQRLGDDQIVFRIYIIIT